MNDIGGISIGELKHRIKELKKTCSVDCGKTFKVGGDAHVVLFTMNLKLYQCKYTTIDGIEYVRLFAGWANLIDLKF